MFSYGPQFDITSPVEDKWCSLPTRNPFQQFSIIGINEAKFYSTKQKPTAVFLEEQAQLISTEKNPSEIMRYPVEKFYICHRNLSDELTNMLNQNRVSQASCSNFYNPISNIISEYDQNLMHLPDDILYIFFDYTDLLEAVLLVSKRRHINVALIKDIIEKLNDNYSKIYSLMSNNCNDISSTADELSNIKEEIRNRGLLPTDDEYDAEISEISTTLNDEEKEDLACMFTR